MLTRNLMKEASIALSVLAFAGSVACNSAEAMARAPSASPAVVPATVPILASSGDQAKGYQLGQRNGRILVDRLKQRTVDTQGCVALGDLESALIKVTRSVRPPAQSGDRMVTGFYQGYLDAVRNAIQEVRSDCDALSYDSGEFAGDLYGALVCQVVSVDIKAVSELQLIPLYDGWSGGSAEVLSSCRSSIEATITACAGSSSSISVQLAADAACSDVSSGIL